MECIDFALRIVVRSSDEFDVQVVEYPSREKQTHTVLLSQPIAHLSQTAEIDDLCEQLRKGILTAGIAGECVREMQQIGGIFRRILFPGKIWLHFCEQLESARAEEKLLRIRLSIKRSANSYSPSIHTQIEEWPFEYTFIEEWSDGDYPYEAFLALNPNVLFVRDPALDPIEDDFPLVQRLRILLVTSNPAEDNEEWPQLPNVLHERKRIENALRPLLDAKPPLATLEVLHNPTPGQFESSIRDGYHALIYLGHGDLERGLVLRGAGKNRYLDGQTLASNIKGTPTQLVVINACWTAVSLAPHLSTSGVPAVLAMRFEMPDATAELLGEVFWRAAVNYLPIDVCVSKVRETISQVRGQSRPDWGIPILFLRSRHAELFGQEDPWLSQFLQRSEHDYVEWRNSTFFRGYADVYVNPNHIFLAPSEQELISGERKFEKYSVMQAVAEFTPLLVLGDPGVGKTTALREISRQFLTKYVRGEGLLPLYVPVVRVSSSPADAMTVVEELLRTSFRRLYPGWDYDPAIAWARIADYPFLFLFDGLNEIPEEKIPRYCESLHKFVDKLREIQPKARVVISSRLDNLSGHKISTKKLTKYIFEVQKLTDNERLEQFAAKYLPDQAVLEEFLLELQEKETFRQMAQNAFLLTSMILIFELDRNLPDNRALLLQRLSQLMLADQQTEISSPYAEMSEQLLAHLAFTLREQKRGMGTVEEEAKEILEAGVEILRKKDPETSKIVGPRDVPLVIEDLVKRRILARSHPVLKFWLEIIQEYFAACVVAHDLERVYGRIGRLSEEDAKAFLRIRTFIRNPDWRQILAIAVGLINVDAADIFIRGVEKRQPVLAATCLANRPSMPSRFFVGSIGVRLSRLIQLSIGLTWVNTLLSAIGIYLLLKWGLPDLTGLLKGSLIKFQRFGLSSFSLMIAYVLLVAGIAGFAPTYWFRFLDWGEEKILERILPDRYIQPLLRSLVILNTYDAALALSSLETEYGRKKGVPGRIKAYVSQANRVWRFRLESVDALVSMLKDPALADYAIDRLGQIGNPKVIPELLEIAWAPLRHSAENAIWTVARIAKDGDDQTQVFVKTELKGILEARKLNRKVRLASYEALISLGEKKDELRAPRWWDGLGSWLHPDVDIKRGIKLSLLAALVLLVVLSLTYLWR